VKEGEQQSHEGYEWMYVLGAAGPEPTEVLTLFGPQGERIHVRARPRGQRPRPASS
jgi:hypothetical protein